MDRTESVLTQKPADIIENFRNFEKKNGKILNIMMVHAY
jgi:hypothetical protein